MNANKFLVICCVIFSAISLYGHFKLPSARAIWDPNGKDKGYCGVVVDKQQPTELNVHKHSGDLTINDRMVIKFDAGFYKAMDVNTDTWYKKNIGDRVCFDLSYYRVNGKSLGTPAWAIFYIITWLLLVATSGVLLANVKLSRIGDGLSISRIVIPKCENCGAQYERFPAKNEHHLHCKKCEYWMLFPDGSQTHDYPGE